MKIFKLWIKDQTGVLWILALCWLIQLYMLWVSWMPMSLVFYISLLEALPVFLWALFSIARFKRKIRQLERAGFEENPIYTSPNYLEKMLLQKLKTLNEKQRLMELNRREKAKQKEDLYLLWAHQNKLPIASLHLLLKQEPVNVRACLSQLVRMENYTQMVLAVSRLESQETDYHFEILSLLELVQEAVRPFIPELIAKHIQLQVQESAEEALTDKKWLVFVLEQIISNAVKYTSSRISIWIKDGTITIEDDGCGITLQDQQRLFTRGVTGLKGRSCMESTGLGLYLSKRILDEMNHAIRIESGVNQGCRVFIVLQRNSLETE